MIKISTGKSEYVVDLKGGGYSGSLNKKQFSATLLQKNKDVYSIAHNHQVFNIEILEVDAEEKTGKAKINNKVVGFSYKTEMDDLLAKLNMSGLADKKVAELKSPMPGLVADILVKAGEKVKKDQPILVLEAMKMENVLKAPGDVTIKKVIAKKGQAVEKNDVLIYF